jgi:hypothetical protein
LNLRYDPACPWAGFIALPVNASNDAAFLLALHLNVFDDHFWINYKTR